MKRIKSFTLIEIMVASLIFLVVAATSVSAFALIRSSNNKSDDVRLADQCARQVRERLSEVVRVNQSQSRIAGIKDPGGVNLIESEDSTKTYAGVAVFDSSTTAKVIYKETGVYYIKDYKLVDETTISPSPEPRSVIMSSDCAAFQTLPPGLVWTGDFNKPFKVYYLRHYPDYDASKNEDKIYKIALEDLVFRSSDNGQIVENEASSSEKQTTSKLFADLTNSSRKLW